MVPIFDQKRVALSCAKQKNAPTKVESLIIGMMADRK